jgi:hypothetical protein
MENVATSRKKSTKSAPIEAPPAPAGKLPVRTKKIEEYTTYVEAPTQAGDTVEIPSEEGYDDTEWAIEEWLDEGENQLYIQLHYLGPVEKRATLGHGTKGEFIGNIPFTANFLEEIQREVGPEGGVVRAQLKNPNDRHHMVSAKLLSFRPVKNPVKRNGAASTFFVQSENGNPPQDPMKIFLEGFKGYSEFAKQLRDLYPPAPVGGNQMSGEIIAQLAEAKAQAAANGQLIELMKMGGTPGTAAERILTRYLGGEEKESQWADVAKVVLIDTGLASALGNVAQMLMAYLMQRSQAGTGQAPPAPAAIGPGAPAPSIPVSAVPVTAPATGQVVKNDDDDLAWSKLCNRIVWEISQANTTYAATEVFMDLREERPAMESSFRKFLDWAPPDLVDYLATGAPELNKPELRDDAIRWLGTFQAELTKEDGKPEGAQ